MSASSDIRLGRRALEGLAGIEVLSDIEDSVAGWYFFRVRLIVDESSAFVPASTEWFVFAERDYPVGRVNLHPAEDRGLHATFRHMERNDPVNARWRAGVPCLDRPGRWLGSRELVNQPTSADARIRWHVERCREWLIAAAADTLTAADEPFELPKFPVDDDSIVGFDEDAGRFARWNPLLGRAGRVTIARLSDRVCAAFNFFVRDASAVSSRWGQTITASSDYENGFWITFRDVPVLPPWYGPATWGELRAIAKTQKVDLDGLLRWVYHHMHEANISCETTLLLGFPIPLTYDGPSVRMHWQAVTLPPPVSVASLAVRKSSQGAWPLERYSLLADDKPIHWRNSACWSQDRLAVRGSLSPELRRARVVIIGAGALASAVSDYLVREGVNDITICDYETFEVENVPRHRLLISSAQRDKAEALAQALNDASPFANVRYTGAFPYELGALRDAVREAEIIIDCTASDDVLSRMASFEWAAGERFFFSVSLGVDARRLFFFAYRGANFPASAFFELIRPYLDEERALLHEWNPQLLFAAGCWNPVFPARWDNVCALAADAVALIDRTLCEVDQARGLQVLERR